MSWILKHATSWQTMPNKMILFAFRYKANSEMVMMWFEGENF